MYEHHHPEHPIEDIHAEGLVWSLDFPAVGDQPAWTWRHYDLVNARARAILDADKDWPDDARLILTGTDETPRIIPDVDVIAGVLPTYARTGDLDEFDLVHWHFAASRERLVTARRRGARSLAAVYHQLRADFARVGAVPHGPAAVVDLCLADFARASRARLVTLADDLDAIEDTLLERRWPGRLSSLAGRIGQSRREAVILKRALLPIARVLDEMEEDAPPWVQTDEHEHTRNAVMGVLDDIAALNDRARSLQDELGSRQTDETNRRLYTVSIVTVLLLPATFVTGFFGMNTSDLPWSGEGVAHGTAYAGLACLAAVLVTLILLKWKRLL